MVSHLLDLPMEMLVLIVIQCEVHDSIDGESWTPLSYQSKCDIRNLQLVCTQVRAAAYQSFGKVLGSRRYCLTDNHMEELKAIGANDLLAPWIKTLNNSCVPPYDSCFPLLLRGGTEY